jgi:2-dehydro-3-deoxygluconokinase
MTRFIAIGEPLIRLSPPAGVAIGEAHRLEMHVGGAACNVAIAAAGLGADATLAAAVGDGPLCDRIERTLRAHRVRPRLRRDADGRVGCYWVETVGGRRAHYDRSDTPMATVDAETLRPLIDLEAAEMVYYSGIAPALGSEATTTATAILTAAQEADCTTVVDANYRQQLWGPERAREAYETMFGHTDVIVVAARDAETVFGLDVAPPAIAQQLQERFGASMVICTRGADGAVGIDADGTTHEQPAVATVTRDPIGAGDAFVGAVCATLLQGGDLGAALVDATAAAAVAHTTRGDLTPLSRDRLRAVTDPQMDR